MGKYSLIGWGVTQDNVECIDTVNCLRVHVNVDIFEEVFQTLCVQLGHALQNRLHSFAFPRALKSTNVT